MNIFLFIITLIIIGIGTLFLHTPIMTTKEEKEKFEKTKYKNLLIGFLLMFIGFSIPIIANLDNMKEEAKKRYEKEVLLEQKNQKF